MVNASNKASGKPSGSSAAGGKQRAGKNRDGASKRSRGILANLKTGLKSWLPTVFAGAEAEPDSIQNDATLDTTDQPTASQSESVQATTLTQTKPAAAPFVVPVQLNIINKIPRTMPHKDRL